ncbi:MAG TPA: TlpA disulfide reductase family protein [Caulobacter sp.]|nr:TlpA disulfide reductase family protein [Caulobacter sp.]
MSEVSRAGRRPDVLRWAITVAILLGALAVLYVILSAVIKPNGPANLASLKRGGLEKLEVVTAPKPQPTASFKDAGGKDVRLADFKGKVLVVNFWATWCAPCKVEMPTLSRLAATYRGQDVAVIAVSIDRDDKDGEARVFIGKNRPLDYYRDTTGSLPFLMDPPALGMPTTVVYDRKGVERARVSGEADWGSPEAMELVRALLAEPR